jgi:AcrR family transcriptional regulator
MGRTVKEHDERRSEILDTAQQFFYQKGYEQTSIQDIITAIGIAKGTFYYYFDSKLALLDELIERILDQTLQVVEPIVDDPQLDALEKFNRLIDTAQTRKIEDKTFYLSILQIWYEDENILLRNKLENASAEAMTSVLAKIIRQGEAEGVFDTVYPDEIGELITLIGQSLSKEVAITILNARDNGRLLSTIERKAAVHEHAIERLLGAPKDSVRLYDADQLRQWFE